jgi:hypothetical protein
MNRRHCRTFHAKRISIDLRIKRSEIEEGVCDAAERPAEFLDRQQSGHEVMVPRALQRLERKQKEEVNGRFCAAHSDLRNLSPAAIVSQLKFWRKALYLARSPSLRVTGVRCCREGSLVIRKIVREKWFGDLSVGSDMVLPFVAWLFALAFLADMSKTTLL